MARSIQEKGASVEGKTIPDQDLGLPDFSLDDSGSNSETDESSASSCYSEASENDKMFLSNNSKDSNDDGMGVFSPVTINSGRPATVSTNLTFGSAECNISQQEKNYTGLSDESILGLSHASFQNCSPDTGHLGCVNLDVTAMIAYVSATSNGGANFIFQDKFLNEQAACERQNPVKKTLHQYFEGKKFQYLYQLVCFIFLFLFLKKKGAVSGCL